MINFKDPKYLLSYLQIIVICSSALIALLFFGLKSSYSLLCGGVSWFLPSLYFAKQIFNNSFPPKPNQTAQSLLMIFLGSELKKLVLSGVLVILFVYFMSPNILAFLSGFVLALLSIWLYPLLKLR